MKPVFANLRAKGHISVAYIDDSYLQGSTYNECKRNIDETKQLLTSLDFVINTEKSVLTPCQSLKFLGFIINSADITLRVTDKKVQKLKHKIDTLRHCHDMCIRQVSELLGLMVAYDIAVPYGRLYSKSIEIDKIRALKMNRGNFDGRIHLSALSWSDINWWYDNIDIAVKHLRQPPPSIELYTDASLTSGWGPPCVM